MEATKTGFSYLYALILVLYVFFSYECMLVFIIFNLFSLAV